MSFSLIIAQLKFPRFLKKSLVKRFHIQLTILRKNILFENLFIKKVKINSWSGFGIDLALGSNIDKKATSYEHMFLPSYVYEQLSHTNLNTQPLIKDDILIYDSELKNEQSNFIFSPFFWLSLLLVTVGFITYHDFQKRHQK